MNSLIKKILYLCVCAHARACTRIRMCAFGMEIKLPMTASISNSYIFGSQLPVFAIRNWINGTCKFKNEWFKGRRGFYLFCKPVRCRSSIASSGNQFGVNLTNFPFDQYLIKLKIKPIKLKSEKNIYSFIFVLKIQSIELHSCV